MKLRSPTKTLIASLTLAAMAAGAQADVVKIDGYTANGINYGDFVVAPNVYSGIAALWNVQNLDDGSSFLAYCIEILQSVDRSNTANYTSGIYQPSADVKELYDRYYGTITQSRERAVGFQLALWDLTGQVPVAAFAAPADAVAQAKLMRDDVLTGTSPYTINNYRFVRWSNDGLQDVLAAQLVPSNQVSEPSSLLLALGGLGLMGTALNRRQRRRADESVSA